MLRLISLAVAPNVSVFGDMQRKAWMYWTLEMDELYIHITVAVGNSPELCHLVAERSQHLPRPDVVSPGSEN